MPAPTFAPREPQGGDTPESIAMERMREEINSEVMNDPRVREIIQQVLDEQRQDDAN